MEAIIPSGHFQTNRFAHFSLLAYEEVLGKNGMNALLNLIGKPELIDRYPADNLERQFDFSNFSSIHIGLEEMMGARGGRAMALRAGRVTFTNAFKDFGLLAGLHDPSFMALPLPVKMSMALPAFALVFTKFSDQSTTVSETGDAFIWSIHLCPVCWGRKSADKPICSFYNGFLQAFLRTISDGLEFDINEDRCCACGDAVCEFVIMKDPVA